MSADKSRDWQHQDSADWFTFAPDVKEGEDANRSPAYWHQFGNPDTKHGKPGADVKAEEKIRPYIPGYSGHIPSTLDKIGGGAWSPTKPYALAGPGEDKGKAVPPMTKKQLEAVGQ